MSVGLPFFLTFFHFVSLSSSEFCYVLVTCRTRARKPQLVCSQYLTTMDVCCADNVEMRRLVRLPTWWNIYEVVTLRRFTWCGVLCVSLVMYRGDVYACVYIAVSGASMVTAHYPHYHSCNCRYSPLVGSCNNPLHRCLGLFSWCSCLLSHNWDVVLQNRIHS